MKVIFKNLTIGPFEKWTIIAGILSCLFVVLNLNTTTNTNPSSRLAFIESFVHMNTFSIENSRFQTVDKASINGITISSKPPVLSFLVSIFYFFFWMLTGYSLQTNTEVSIWAISFVTGFLSHILTLTYVFLLARMMLRSHNARLLVFYGACFGHFGILFAKGINNHTIAGALLLMVFFHGANALRTNNANLKILHLCLFGLSAGLLSVIDLPSGAFSIAMMIYMLVRLPRMVLVYSYLCAAFPIAIHFILMYLSTGSIIPVQLTGAMSGLYQEPDGIAFRLFQITFGQSGIISMVPVIIFGFFGLIKAIQGRFRDETIVFGLALLIIFSFYLFSIQDYGGWSFGFRWLLPIVPILIVYGGVFLDEFTSAYYLRTILSTIFLIFIGLGAVQVLQSQYDEWFFSPWFQYMESTIISSCYFAL